jgi:thiamine pyrophosphokinase
MTPKNLSKATIFANGEITADSISLTDDEMVIAADGGARHCLNLEITPQVVIGDFDSLTEEETAILATKGAELIRYPPEKDETDLELALDYALETGASEITLYGLLGGRWDMTFANLLLLAASRYAGIEFHIKARGTTAYIVRGGETIELRAKPGTTVSIIPLDGPARGITYRGLQWPLEDATLPFGTPRGVSNVMVKKAAEILLREGTVAVFVINPGAA